MTRTNGAAMTGRRGRVAASIGCLIALVSGGSPTAVADSAGDLVPPGKVESLILSGAEVGDIVGVTFEWNTTKRKPFKSDDLGKDSACALLMGPDVETFGRDYTGYVFRVDRDTAEHPDFIVQQRVAAYSDADTAAQTFQKAFNKGVMAKCNGTIVVDNDDNDSQMRFRMQNISLTSAKWVADQLVNDEPLGYSCANLAGVESNVIFGVKVCQYGNGGPTAATMAERIVSQTAGVRI